MDTGVNHAHPSLQPATKTADMHTFQSAWDTDDRHGHGTNMAGLFVYYASHGLRFDVCRPLESLIEFKQRINQKALDEENAFHGAKSENDKWLLGEKLRSLGSVHSDTWTGQAAELAERVYIAVYPVSGWW